MFYKPGPLMNICLEIVNMPGRPSALAPRQGFPDRERLKLQRFISGAKVLTRHGQAGRSPRVIKRISREGARDLTFTGSNGQPITVAAYFQGVQNRPLQFPDVVCVEVLHIPLFESLL